MGLPQEHSVEAALPQNDFSGPKGISGLGRIDPDNLRGIQLHCGQRQRIRYVRWLDERDPALSSFS
jgi:hypothetical protein